MNTPDEHWTVTTVAARLEEAAMTMQALPDWRLKGLRAGWPDVIHDRMDAYGWTDADAGHVPPGAEAIVRMDEVMQWMALLHDDRQAQKVVWARANRIPWRILVKRFRYSRSTLSGQWKAALATIAFRLSRRKAQKEHGHVFFLDKLDKT